MVDRDDIERFFHPDAESGGCVFRGTDSAFVLWAAKKYGCDVRAYYVRTAFQPAFEYEDARRLAKELDVPMTVVELDILSVPGAAENGPQRCYHCKHAIFTHLWKAAHADGYPALLDGTNASDDAGDRPGMRALKELEVRSPLRECGITKLKVRELSREAGLFTWDKPAYACLATRIPAGDTSQRTGSCQSGAGRKDNGRERIQGFPYPAVRRGGPASGHRGADSACAGEEKRDSERSGAFLPYK